MDAAEVHGQKATTAYIRGNIAAVKGQLKQACTTTATAPRRWAYRVRLNRSSVYMGQTKHERRWTMLKPCWTSLNWRWHAARAELTCILQNGKQLRRIACV